jgi:hypothetical protein
MTKSKTTEFDAAWYQEVRAKERDMVKTERAAMLKKAKDNGIGIVHIFNQEHPYGGLTVAFAKSSPYKYGKMVTVAVASCSREDNFSKKIGTSLALSKFNRGKTIELPLLTTFDERDLNYAVKSAFSAMYGASLM